MDDPNETEPDDERSIADIQLERAFAKGADDALAAAYRRYARMVLTFARRTVGPEVAEEVTQDASWRPGAAATISTPTGARWAAAAASPGTR